MIQAFVSGVGEIHLENLKRFQTIPILHIQGVPRKNLIPVRLLVWFPDGCKSKSAKPKRWPQVQTWMRAEGANVCETLIFFNIFRCFHFSSRTMKTSIHDSCTLALSMRWNPLCNWMKIDQMPHHLIVHDLYDFTTFWARRESVIYCHHRGPHNASLWLCNSNQQHKSSQSVEELIEKCGDDKFTFTCWDSHK